MLSTTHTLPPGKYFVGDPSFVLDESWNTALQLSSDFTSDMPIALNGKIMWAAPVDSDETADAFDDQHGTEYPVKEFFLGAVPIDLVENPEGEEHGTVVDAVNGMTVSHQDGVFRFNNIVIDTNQALDEFDGGYDLDPDDDKFF